LLRGYTSLSSSESDSLYVYVETCFQKCKDCLHDWERDVMLLRDKEYYPEWRKWFRLDSILPLKKAGEGETGIGCYNWKERTWIGWWIQKCWNWQLYKLHVNVSRKFPTGEWILFVANGEVSTETDCKEIYQIWYHECLKFSVPTIMWR